MEGVTFKQTKHSADRTEYNVKVEYTLFEAEKEKMFEKLAQDVKLPGFRPGKGPRSVIEEKLGLTLYSEALNSLIPEVTYKIIVEEKLNPITSPEYDVKEVEKDEGIEYTFSFTNYPEVTLGDFSKITVELQEAVVTDEDAHEVIKNIVRSSIEPDKIKKLGKVKNQKDKKTKTEKVQNSKESKEEFDFELTDELVAELKYEDEKTVKDLVESVKSKLKEMKHNQELEKATSEMIKQAIEMSEFTLPQVLLEQEIANQEQSFRSRLDELQLDPDEYLKSQGSSLDERKKEWKQIAEERLGSDLVLISLASQKNALPTEADVDAEIAAVEDENIREQYKSEQARNYVKTVITKQRGALELQKMVKNFPESKVKVEAKAKKESNKSKK